ncbi:MAG: DUF4396 domain-containing protein [Syntrophales bacterium]
MDQGALGIWFALAGLSVAFVVVDIRKVPAHPVIKWAFIILTVFAGPLGAFFYVLGCREPLDGTHEAYVAARWRQVLGSTMHCAAGDGVGIIAGAAMAARWQFSVGGDFVVEYLLGFGFGWAFFQAFAMRKMAGGSYVRSLQMTFLPEFLSMNVLMAGMQVAMRFLTPRVDGGADPARPGFWFVMSMALIVGFCLAYPVNWWLVTNGMKHGMITVRGWDDHPRARDHEAAARDAHGEAGDAMHSAPSSPSALAKAAMTALTLAVLAAGIVLSSRLGG